jgi:alkylglycerol monooxygenase
MDLLETVGNMSLPLPAGPPDDIYYPLEYFLAAFYLVRPSRTMYADITEVPNFFNMVLQVAPIAFALEIFVLHKQGKRTYRWNDAIVGMGALLLGAIPLAIIEAAWFRLYAWVWERYRIIDLPWDSMWTYLLCMPAMELSNYAIHRGAHEVNVLWLSHQLHHTTEEFVLPAGIRFTLIDKFLINMGCLPWAFLLPPGPAKAHHQLNLIFQFWVHTQTIGDLGPIEWIFYTPTQHAIHHGINRYCIDKNYGGFLNIWDQFFGTMVWPKDHKGEKIYFGLLGPVKTWDIFYLYAYPFRDIYRRIKKYDNFADKMGVLFKGPGWEPGKPRLGNVNEIPEDPGPTYEQYDKQSPWYVYLYCIAHLIVVWQISAYVVTEYWSMPASSQLIAHALVLWTVIDTGYMLEHKYFAPALEWIRCASFFAFEILLTNDIFSKFNPAFVTAARILCAVSAVGWTFNFNLFSPKSKLE